LSRAIAESNISVDLVTLEPVNFKLFYPSNVKFTTLGKTRFYSYFLVFFRLLSLVHRKKPDIIHGYMWDCNILSCLITQILPKIKLVFGIRCSAVKAEQYGYLSYFLSKFEFLISCLADCIISNSHDGVNRYKSNSFISRKCSVVYNGIDTSLFKYDQVLRDKQRSVWRIKKGEKVIGMLARVDPMKGHENFVRAAISICKKRSDVKFLCIGRYHDLKLKNKLTQTIEKNHMSERIIFYEESSSPVDTLCAFDIFCSPSVYGEGFSNVLAEAMSCGRICIATDVGEARNIIYDKNMICRYQDINCLKYVIEKSLQLVGFPTNNRDHIIRNFSLKKLETKSLDIFSKLYHSF
jgi:glycosyltransferase involved in cell wall biosynthesis